MHFDDLKTLEKDEIIFRMKTHDHWRLQDIILLVFGYDHKGVDWDYISSTNAFPIRQYGSALAATNERNPKKRLNYIHKNPSSDGFSLVTVKKRDFFEWARKEWAHEPAVVRVYSIWKNYKKENMHTAPSLETNCAKAKNFGDKIQIEEFIEHCKKGRSPEKYKANISAIAKLGVEKMSSLKYQKATFRKYIKRMTTDELAEHSKSKSLKSNY
jgi:hypothetical protein